MSILSPIIFSIVHKGDSRFFWSKEVQIFKKMWGQRSKDRCFQRSKVKRSLIFVCWSVWLKVRRGKGKYWRSVVPALIGILIFSSYCCFMGDPCKHPHTMVKICMTTVWEDIRIISDKWNGGKYFWNRPHGSTLNILIGCVFFVDCCWFESWEVILINDIDSSI